MKYNVLIANSNVILAEGLKSLFSLSDDFNVTDVVFSYDDIATIDKKTKKDIYIIDYEFVKFDLKSLVNHLKDINSSSKILFFSDYKDIDCILKIYDSDADGCISFKHSFDELCDILKTILSGDKYFESEALPLINHELLERDAHKELVESLTKREKEILIRVAMGMSNKEIASDCDISERTVKNHLSNIFVKIKVADRTQAAVFAIRTNLVQL